MKSAPRGDRQASGRDAPKGRRARAAEPWIARSKVFFGGTPHLRCGVTILGFLRGGRVCAVAVELPDSQREERVPEGAAWQLPAPSGVGGPPPPALVTPIPAFGVRVAFPGPLPHSGAPGKEAGRRPVVPPPRSQIRDPSPGFNRLFFQGLSFPICQRGSEGGGEGWGPC